jgi:hypothetical protein
VGMCVGAGANIFLTKALTASSTPQIPARFPVSSVAKPEPSPGPPG